MKPNAFAAFSGVLVIAVAGISFGQGAPPAPPSAGSTPAVAAPTPTPLPPARDSGTGAGTQAAPATDPTIEAARDVQAEDATFGNSGISTDPQWDVLAAAAISSMDVDQPAAGFGLQYATSRTLLRVFVRKNLANNSVPGVPGDEAFGHATVNPSLGSFSASVRGELGLHRPWISDKRVVRWGIRSYAEFSAARDRFDLTYTDGGEEKTLSKSAVPLALSGGFAFKLDGVMPNNAKFGGSGLLMLEPYLGMAWRSLGGDWNSQQRTLLWNKQHDAQNFLGVEAGAFLQFGSILLEPKMTWLGAIDSDMRNGFRHARVDGLTSIQFDLRIAFFVPWTVVGNTEKPEYAAKEDAAAAARQKDEADAKAKEAKTAADAAQKQLSPTQR